jgi:hypothetical protein
MAKEPPMPAQDGLGLDDEKGLAPGAQATGEQDQERTVGRSAPRAFHTAAEDDYLVTEEGILHQQLGLAARQVGQGTGDEGRGRRLSEGAEPLVKAVGEGLSRGRQVADEASHHGRFLLEQ